MRTGRLGVSMALALTLIATSAAQSKFTLKVHTGRGQVGYDVNSTMIIGERDMVVIDPQFSLSEAHKLAAEILESKKRLDDHLLDARAPGPSLRTGSAEAGVSRRRRSSRCRRPSTPRRPAGRRARSSGSPTYGNNIPGPEPVLPEELATPVLTLEGEEFPITGGVQGADGPGNSFVWVPSPTAVVTGDIVFDHVYFGVPRDAARENWMKTINQIVALIRRVISRPRSPGATHDLQAIEWMKKYMADWDANVAKSKTAAEMRTNVLRQYPLLGMEFTLNNRIATVLPGEAGAGQVISARRGQSLSLMRG